MSWISGNCQGDKRYECYYQSIEPVFDENGFATFPQWCKDSDSTCPITDPNGPMASTLVSVVDHQSGGGGW